MTPITLDQYATLPAREKKAFLERAADFSNREQAKLMRKYKRMIKKKK